MSRLFTTAEAAKELGVTPSAISHAVKAGRLKYTRKLEGRRGQFLFTQRRLDAYKESRWKR